MASAKVWTDSRLVALPPIFKGKIAGIIEPFPNDVVVFLAGLSGQSHQELVQLPRVVNQLGVEERIGEWNSCDGLPFILHLFH